MNDDVLRELCDELSLEEKVHLLTGRDSWSTNPLPRIGLRSMVLSDGPAGVRGATWDERSPSANFPSPTAIAASWDREALRTLGEALGQEARRKGAHVVLGPTINLQRSPYGGRHFEAFSEDPLLTSELATAYVRGVQSQGVGATPKHYVANDSETDRFTVDVRVDERTLRELYLRAFEGPVVDGGAWLVMSAYNSVNGVRATESDLLREPLKGEWGFDGVVVSDWTAVRSIASARQPQDLVMPGPDGPWGAALVAAVRAGEVDESLIDDKVVRLLRLAARTGALDGVEQRPTPTANHDPRAVARQAAIDGSVLLRNDGLLPFRSPASIAVIGEGVLHPRTQGGGSATVIPESVVSPWDGIRERWPEARATWSRGAVVDTGHSPLPADSYRAPSGEPGMLVAYLATDGSELSSEVRRASTIVSFDAASLAVRSASIELRFRYRPDEAHTATFPFAVSGLCDYDVIVDSVAVASGELRTRPEDDPAAAVLHPPATFLTLPRSSPEPEIVVRLRPVEGGIPDALSFGVGLPPFDADPDELIAEAADAAASADVAVVVVSTSPEVESEGFDRSSLRLPGRQDDLVRAVLAANPRTVVVVNSGSPVLLPWAEDAAAILATWFPGQEAGAALADILSGDAEPGGRLPVTWPADEESVPVSEVTPTEGRLVYREGVHVGYRAWLREAAGPAFGFGHGLGFTAWQISDLEIPASAPVGTGVDVAVRIANVGARRGKAVVQVYLERVSSSEWDRPARWLAAFETVTLDGGAASDLALVVPSRAFAVWDDGAWVTEPGMYRVIVGTSIDGDAVHEKILIET